MYLRRSTVLARWLFKSVSLNITVSADFERSVIDIPTDIWTL